MWLVLINFFIFLHINVFLHGEDIDCRTSTISNFVRDSLPKICFGQDSAGYLNYSMDHVDFYNAHCRLYQDVKECLSTKVKHCDDIQAGFTRHALSLIESYQLPIEYFDFDAKIYDDNHYLQNLIPFCDGDKLSRKIECSSQWNILIDFFFSRSFQSTIRSIFIRLFDQFHFNET